MKIIITGHKRGIGKSIYEYFLNKKYDVIGFSKSNGYDISDKKIRQIIYEECLDTNIFVNNAYNDHDDSQFLLLKNVSEIWKNTDNTIINISSTNTDIKNIYGKRKKELDDYCKTIKKPNIINLKPSYVDTERVSYINKNKMSCEDIIQILDFCLNSNLKIEEVKFRCKQTL